jgi:hypothetical protein
MEEGADIEKLNLEENVNMQVRPYLSLFATLIMFIGIACILYPLCDVITVLGLPATPCILIVTFGSFFAALCVATFLMFVIWMCTRTIAAVVFLLISISGQVRVLLCTSRVSQVFVHMRLFTLRRSLCSNARRRRDCFHNFADMACRLGYLS